MSEETSTISTSITSLQQALEAEEFPEVDLALRRGRHVDRDDTAWFGYLVDAQDVLEEFYRRYSCELVQRADGYFFLLPSGEKLRKKHLSTGAMLVGQALALLYLDPATAGAGGLVSRDELLSQLDGVVGTDALIRCFNPKRRRYDERVAQETVRKKVAVEVRRLAGLGFVEVVADEQIRLRPALLRFAEPVRGLADPAEALAKLVASGEVQIIEEPTDDSDELRDGDVREDEELESDVAWNDASGEEPARPVDVDAVATSEADLVSGAEAEVAVPPVDEVVVVEADVAEPLAEADVTKSDDPSDEVP